MLVYGLSAPFWILSTKIPRSELPDNLPLTDIGAVLTPTITAAILRYREAGALGIRELFGRTFDYGRIPDRRWFVTAVVMFPLLYLVIYVAMRTMDYSVTALGIPSLSLTGVFLLFFVAAAAEELVTRHMKQMLCKVA